MNHRFLPRNPAPFTPSWRAHFSSVLRASNWCRAHATQVEDLRQQLQAAEDTARERELQAAAAAERAAAAQGLIDSLRARAVAAEAEAKPLRAQLAELADTLDVKVCFRMTSRTVSAYLNS